MKIASLGSGSAGNATLISHQNTQVLVDCGFSLGETEGRLQRLNLLAEDIDAILVTHEHSDHIRGVGALGRKYKIPVYLTSGTFSESRLAKLQSLKIISAHQPFTIAGLQIEPVPVPHDAREPCQFVFSDGNKRIGVLTDLGSVTPHILQSYQQLDGLLLECNHDLEMLDKGPYPYPVKQRIRGNFGHLSNTQAAEFLNGIDLSRLQHLILSHISRQNNTSELAVSTLEFALDCGSDFLTVADQANGFDWLSID